MSASPTPTESGEKALQVNGVPCTAPYVKNETYPLFRYDWAVLPSSSPSIPVEQFFDWVQTSAAAGKVISKAGAVRRLQQVGGDERGLMPDPGGTCQR